MLLIQSDVLQWSQGFKVDVGRGPCDSRNFVSRLESSNVMRAERPTAKNGIIVSNLAVCKILAKMQKSRNFQFSPTPSSSKFYYSQWLVPSGSRAMALTPSYSAALRNTTLRFALSLSTASYGSSPLFMM